MRKYDAQHQTSDDYTLMLEDVPREASEVGSHSGIVGLPGLGITLGLSYKFTSGHKAWGLGFGVQANYGISSTVQPRCVYQLWQLTVSSSWLWDGEATKPIHRGFGVYHNYPLRKFTV